MKNLTALVCGGGEKVYQALVPAFEEENITAIYAANGADSNTLFGRRKVDVGLVDEELFFGQYREMFRRALRDDRAATIVLGRSGRVEDEIFYLRSGADDYVPISAPPRLVVARTCAALRHRGIYGEEKSIRLAEMIIYPESFRISLHGKEIDLIPSDFKLLRCLAENAGKVLTREQLQNMVWGYEYYGSPRAVDTQIKRLRKALDMEKPHFAIQTVYGVGYKLDLLQE